MEGARTATSADAPALIALVRQATEELAPHRGGQVWRQHDAWPEPIDEAITARCGPTPPAGTCAVVGTIDDTVIGYGLGRLDPLHDGTVLAVVTDLFVDPAARAVGVGEAMMDLLVAWATEHQAIGIDALALPGDRETKNFFETFGLTARALVVHRSLPGAEPS